MSTITITLTDICSGGNHLTLAVTGDKSLTSAADLSMLTEPMSDKEVEGFLKVICKMAKNGRTIGQARTLLQAGVTVTV